MNTHRFLALATLFSALTAAPAFGSVVSFHDLAGDTPPDFNFTLTQGTGTVDLINYEDGEFTGVTLDVQHTGSISTFNGVEIPYVGDFADLFPEIPEGDISYRQSLYLGGATTTFTFFGLTAGQTYDIAIFADRGYDPGASQASRSATFTLTGAASFINISSAGTIISGDEEESTEVQNGHNPDGYLVRYSNIVPDTDEITITVTGSGYSGNALRFETIPEPAGDVATITGQPRNQTALIGATVTLTAQATGGAPLAYQWQKEVGGVFTDLADGAGISGATGTELTLSNVQAADAGNYRVVVSNAGGAATSRAAVVAVVGPPTIDINLHPGIVVNATVGYHYQVEYREELAGPEEWQLLQDIPSLPSTPYVVYDPVAVVSKRFYRVVFVPAP